MSRFDNSGGVGSAHSDSNDFGGSTGAESEWDDSSRVGVQSSSARLGFSLQLLSIPVTGMVEEVEQFGGVFLFEDFC